MCVCEHVTFYVAVRLFGVKTMGDRRVLTAAGWLHLNQFFPPTLGSPPPFFSEHWIALMLTSGRLARPAARVRTQHKRITIPFLLVHG